MVWRYRGLSSIAASSLRYLERLVEKIKKGIVNFSANPPGLLEYLLVKVVRLGDRIEYGIVYIVGRFTEKMSIIQKSLARSVLLASLWIGLLFTLALMLIAVLLSWG